MSKASLARFYLKHGYSKERVQRWLSYHLGRKITVENFTDLKNKTYMALSQPIVITDVSIDSYKWRDMGYYDDLLRLWRRLRVYQIESS